MDEKLVNVKLVDLLLEAFTDVLDGCKGPHEIKEKTGLPDERCEEIYNLYLVAMKGRNAILKLQ